MTGVARNARAVRRGRGFVLVNALVLVAALAAAAALLLARAEAGRARLGAGLEAAQLKLNLDAFEALAATLLARDTGAVDHAGEAWARPVDPVPLARGTVAGKITDLQGRFNINWLADPSDTTAQAAFDRLAERLGVPAAAGTAIRAALAPDGPPDPAAWLRLTPPETPVGGALLMRDQLARIPGLSPRALDRLTPFVTALPADSTLNVNTAAPEVLAAFLPHLPPAALARLLRDRPRDPWRSIEAFQAAAGLAQADTEEEETDAPDAATLPAERLSVGSSWFRAEITATLAGRQVHRSTVLHRRGAPATVTPAWRLTRWP